MTCCRFGCEGCCAQVFVCRFGSCLTKIQNFGTPKKWKMYFLWDKTKIGLCGVSRHQKGHARVRYDPISTNCDD
jgi:hypothetical protein